MRKIIGLFIIIIMIISIINIPHYTDALNYTMDSDLSNADASFWGEDAGDSAGMSVAGAGDVNGDGYDDILIGALLDEDGGFQAGQTYIIFGKASGWAIDANLSNADASFWGEDADDLSGRSIAGAGDVNGDGYDDILIGAIWDEDGGSQSGQTYLIFGKASGWVMDTDLSNVDASFWGEAAEDRAGWSVAGAGDVNGDGYDDILIGARLNDDGGSGAGQTYLILGKTSGWAMDTDLSNADASFWGEDSGDGSGSSVAGAGDVNGDGYDDILIGAPSDDDGGIIAGQTYLIFGKASGWYMDTDLSFADASFWGEDLADISGGSVAGAGDVNSDGYDDILIGANGDDDGGNAAGQTYLILGKASGWSMDTDLSNADASFWGEDAEDRSGASVAGAGDVNGDGYDDIIIGAPGDEDGGGLDTGQTYLILGNASGWSMDTDLSNADASFWGEDLEDSSGSSVAGAGDVNGDGYYDILIGARNDDDGGSGAGQTYLIFPDNNFQPWIVNSVKAYSESECINEISTADIGETVYIELQGSDGNSSRKDMALVNVTSNISSPIGIRLELMETGLNTGIYRGNFTLMDRTHDGYHWIKTTYGEIVNISSITDPSKNAEITVEIPPDIVFVDDDFTNLTTGWGYDHFDTIQDGVNSVDPTGTVFVYNGTYYENVMVNKILTMIGNGTENSIIDALDNGTVVTIDSGSCTLSGFTFTGSDPGETGLYIDSNHNTIENSNISGNGLGIFLQNSNNNTITNNSFSYNGGHGIQCLTSHDNLLRNNTCAFNMGDGISLNSSDVNTFLSNTLINNHGSGLDLKDSNGNDIEHSSSGVNNVKFIPPDTGLLGHWKMDEPWWNGTPGEVHDSSGNGNNGRGNNFITTTVGKFGNAGDFDGLTKYLTIFDHPTLEMGASDFSVGCWFKTGTMANQMLIDKKHGSTGGFILRTCGNGTIEYSIEDVTVETNNWVPLNYDDNQWHHVMMVRDYGNKLYLFFDGEEQDNIQDNTGPLIDSTKNLLFGCRNSPWGQIFNGQIDEVRLFNRHLSHTEVHNIYLNCMPKGIYSNLGHGVSLNHSNNNVINNISISYNNGSGVYLTKSENNVIDGNSIGSNNLAGIYLDNSTNNLNTNNIIENNTNYGIRTTNDSSINNIHHNYILYNNNGFTQASDDGSNNYFDNGSSGNYWSDWLDPDDNAPQGVVDIPYDLDGITNSNDNYPICPWIITPTNLTAYEEVYYQGDNAYFNTCRFQDWTIRTNGTWLTIFSNGTINGTPTNGDVGTYWLNITLTCHHPSNQHQ